MLRGQKWHNNYYQRTVFFLKVIAPKGLLCRGLQKSVFVTSWGWCHEIGRWRLSEPVLCTSVKAHDVLGVQKTRDIGRWSRSGPILCNVTSVKATDVLGVQKRVWNMWWDKLKQSATVLVYICEEYRRFRCSKTSLKHAMRSKPSVSVHGVRDQVKDVWQDWPRLPYRTQLSKSAHPCIISNLEAVLFPEIWVTVVRLSGPILFPDAFGWWFANPFRPYFSNASRCGALTESSTR